MSLRLALLMAGKLHTYKTGRQTIGPGRGGSKVYRAPACQDTGL